MFEQITYRSSSIGCNRQITQAERGQGCLEEVFTILPGVLSQAKANIRLMQRDLPLDAAPLETEFRGRHGGINRGSYH